MSNDKIVEQLEKVREIVRNLCKERRCPSMSIPVNSSDEDVVIYYAINAAIEALSGDKITGWVDVAHGLPEDGRPVWVVIKHDSVGPIVIEARYYSNLETWTTGYGESERELRSIVYCWHKINVPDLPEWIFEEKRKDGNN